MERTAELRELSENLEQKVHERTAALEASQQKLVAVEKLAGLGRLTAGLAHEINTPLAAAMNYLLQARRLAGEYYDSIGVTTVTDNDHRELAGELRTALAEASATLQRIGEFIRKVRGHTRAADAQVTAFDPMTAATETLAMLEHRAHIAGVKVHLAQIPETFTVYGEPGRFHQVLTNLLTNAIDACAGQAEVRFWNQGDRILMSVQDNGEGIPESVLPKIFDPMFTTKDVGKGEGLGLAIVHDIVRGHFGGEIDVTTKVGGGTTFTVSFPIHAPSEYSSAH